MAITPRCPRVVYFFPDPSILRKNTLSQQQFSNQFTVLIFQLSFLLSIRLPIFGAVSRFISSQFACFSVLLSFFLFFVVELSFYAFCFHSFSFFSSVLNSLPSNFLWCLLEVRSRPSRNYVFRHSMESKDLWSFFDWMNDSISDLFLYLTHRHTWWTLIRRWIIGSKLARTMTFLLSEKRTTDLSNWLVKNSWLPRQIDGMSREKKIGPTLFQV